ncbi:MAG: GNAT family N-acetyltransferase [Lachnospiraceae bacterium]
MTEKTDTQYSIRMACEADWEAAMELAWKTFLKFEAGDYQPEGIDSFHDFISDQWLKKMFLKGEYVMMLALDEERIIGLITLRSRCHISLLFVDGDYHRQGVGSSLIGALESWLSTETDIRYLTVNAAPYALGFYHKLGFWDLAGQQEKEGILYTPMKMIF